MKNEKDAIQAMEAAIDAALLARPGEAIDEALYPPHLQPLAQKIGRLTQSIQEMEAFLRDIANGELDMAPPSRGNYLAGPAKEIHSQLISFCWSIEQLMKGNMVSKLQYPGALFTWYNNLIEKVSQTFGNTQEDTPEWGSAVTSWRYHQIVSAINQLRILLLEVNDDGAIVFANPPVRDVFPDMECLPYGRDDIPKGTLLAYLCTFSGYASSTQSMHEAIKDSSILHELCDASSHAWYKITSNPVQLTDGSWGMLHMIDDISEWKRHEHELRISATIDPLTSAYSRKIGMQKIEELIAARHEQTNCVAFVDIDYLKEINDQYGHTEGDFAIKTVADILLSSVRNTDWVIRYGGDEFVVLFLHCSASVSQDLLDRMRTGLDEFNASTTKPYTLSFSAGLSLIEADMASMADLISVVDERMYADKARRKSQVS